MGYKLTSLVNLPLDPYIEMYVFAIGDGIWEGGLSDIVHRNFDKIAREIGPHAIIIGALQESFHGEVVEKYLGRNYRQLKNLLPALLITNAHPDELTENSLRLLIPLNEAHERYTLIDHFLSDLAAFVRGDSNDLLKRLEDAPKLSTELRERTLLLQILPHKLQTLIHYTGLLPRHSNTSLLMPQYNCYLCLEHNLLPIS